jgi:hypothetical protein
MDFLPTIASGPARAGCLRLARVTDRQPRLIGRGREVEELAALLHAHPVVFVYGALGVGKTALVLHVIESDGRLPPLAYASVDGVTEPRDALARTCAAMGVRAPLADADHVPRAILGLLEAQPRTLVWDDIHEGAVDALAPVVAGLARGGAAARLVLVSRRYFPARTKNIRLPSMQVPPLSTADAVLLVRAHEAERTRTLAEDVAAAAGGNPLLLRLALARAPEAALGDADAALRRAVAEHAAGAGRAVLELLVAAERPLPEADLLEIAGAKDAIERLRQHLVVVKTKDGLAIAAPLAATVRVLLGEPSRETWQAAARLADQALAGAPASADALLLAARARVAVGDAGSALGVLRAHVAARAAAPSAALERVLRDAAKTEPQEALFLLAREQIRAGDYEAARRTLEEVPAPSRAEDRARLRLMRCEALARGGDPVAAARELHGLHDPGARLARAELDVIDGRLEAGRKALLAGKALELRRASALAASYFFEDRFEESAEWVQRARDAMAARPGSPVEQNVVILDVMSLVGLDQVERAEQVLARDGREGREASLLRAAIALRRGDLRAAVEEGTEGMHALGRRADVVFRAICACNLARAYAGLGMVGRAREALRVASDLGKVRGFGVLTPIARRCETDLALLFGGRARHSKARGAARRALDQAEAKLAAAPARAAERAFRAAGLEADLARALCARAEAAAREGDVADAEDALASAEEIAGRRGYVLVLGACALLRAHLAERAGDLGAYAEGVARAAHVAEGHVRDPGLARACRRAGVAAPARGDEAAPWAARVARLGLDRPAEHKWTLNGRAYLLAAREAPPEPFALVVDVDEGLAWSRGARVELPRQRLGLLVALAEAGEAGASIEDLYDKVWGGPPYHPLRHRNTVYVALTRLRASLDPVVGADALIEHGDGRYRLAAAVRVAVRRSHVSR